MYVCVRVRALFCMCICVYVSEGKTDEQELAPQLTEIRSIEACGRNNITSYDY